MRRLAFMAAGVVLFVGGIGGAWLALGRPPWFEHAHPAPVNAAPAIECPDVVDAGEAEIYAIALGRFSVENRGGRELLLSDIRTECTCTGLEIDRDGRLFRVNEVKVPPGQSVSLVIRQGVRGPVGSAIDTPVRFRTNDPACPERTIRLVVPRVTGGVETSPNAIAIGKVQVGAESRHVIEVTDRAIPHRQLDRVVSSNPSRVHVALLPLPPKAADGALAKVEVVIDSSVPAQVDEQVEIYVVGRLFPTIVPVSGRVAAAVEVSPATLVLPRRSGGKLTYEASLLCLGGGGLPIVPRVETCPPDIDVVLGDGDGTPIRHLRVTWNPTLADPNKRDPRVVRFKVKVGEAEHEASVTIHCNPED